MTKVLSQLFSFLEFDLCISSHNLLEQLLKLKEGYTIIVTWQKSLISAKPCSGEKNIIFHIQQFYKN